MQQHASKAVPLVTVIAMLALAVALIAQARTSSTPKQQSGNAVNAEKVDLDALEKNPERFLGKTVTVEGEVDRVLGPNLFTIDERDWVDLDREMPVVVPEPFAAIVRSKAPVRVTGIVEKVPIAKIENRGGRLTDPKIKAEIQTQPALVASEVSSLVPAAVAVDLLVRPETAVGTSGTNAAPVTDVNQIARSTDKSLVGKQVNLRDVTVGTTSDRGFWITTADGQRIFVMPEIKKPMKPGETATVEGVVLEMPEGLRVELKTPGEPIYVYATRVTTR